MQVSEYSLFKYPDYTLPLAVKLAAVARERKLDIFHAHYAVPHATAAYLAVQMLGAAAPKVVTTLHGTDATLLGRDPSYRPAIEHALAASDAVTTVSESLRRETLAAFRLAPERVEVIHNFFAPAPVQRHRAQIRRELGVADDEFLAVHVSNLRPGKRIDLLLQTLAAMRRGRLLILGGEDFSPHAPLAERLGLRERLIVRENIVDVEDYLAASDAGVSASETESFGLALLETLAHGRPVAAFRVGGIPEVVREGETGFLLPFGDIAGLAAALDRLAADPELARTMGKRARSHARETFGAERIVPLYESAYRRLL